MKKLLLLSIILISIYSCKKGDPITEIINEESTSVSPDTPDDDNPTEDSVNMVNGIIEIIDGIDISTVIIQNGSVKKNITEEDFEIDALTDISSAIDAEGNIIYLHSKYLSPDTSQDIISKSNKNSVSIKLTPTETARALLFNSLGLQYISNDTKFYENIGKVIQLDVALEPLFNQLVVVIENDIEANGHLTNLSYQSNILTTYNDAFRAILDLSSTILDWPDSVFGLLDSDLQEYTVEDEPYFVVYDNGSPKRSNKFASFIGGCVVEIKNATKLSDGSWDLNLDFYNKFPAVRYVTEMYFDENGDRVYFKNTLDNIVKPYNSSELYNDITSLATVKDLFVDYVDIAANGILASDWQTTQSTKNEINLNISNSQNHLLAGNVWENNDLFFYSMVDIIGKTMGLMSTIDKIGTEKKDDDSKKDLLKKFVDYLKDPTNEVGVKVTQNIQLILNNSGDLNALNEQIKVLAIDLSTEFLDWIISEAGKAALQIYIDEEKEILVGVKSLNQLKFLEEIFTGVENKDITLDNGLNVLSDKFPFFKAVQSGLKIGTVAQDIAIFFLNIKNPVLSRQVYLPFESEIFPENGSTVDIGTEFNIDFGTSITLTTDNSKKIKVLETSTNNVIQEISINQLTIDNTGQKLIFKPSALDLNTQYYLTLPEGIVLNNAGSPSQGIYTNDIWSFTTSSVINENIYDGNVALTTQQEVDDFGANNYTNINGALEITYNVNNTITNLNSLSSITKVTGGGLGINNFSTQVNLEGLSNITEVNGDVIIQHNSSDLNSLNSLRGLISVSLRIYVTNNSLLNNLNGLINVSSLGSYLAITSNANLSSLCGIKNLILNNEVTDYEYRVSGNLHNPTYEEIQNTGSGGCEE